MGAGGRGLPRCPTINAVVLIVAGVLAGCGESASSTVVARVGRSVVTKAALERWTAAIARGASVPDAAGASSQTPRARALGFLISARWLIAEVAGSDAPLNPTLVAKELEDRQRSESKSNGDYGLSTADVRLKLEAELAASTIRERLAREHAVTPVEVADFYNRHWQRFHVPERRYFEIVTRRSLASAVAAKREIEAGRSIRRMALHEYLDRTAGGDLGSGKDAIKRAIFAAGMHVLSGPIRLYDDRSLFEVTRIVPAIDRSLGQVRAQIRAQLSAARDRGALAHFIAAWRARWSARTECRPGYMTHSCRQLVSSTAIAPQLVALVAVKRRSVARP